MFPLFPHVHTRGSLLSSSLFSCSLLFSLLLLSHLISSLISHFSHISSSPFFSLLLFSFSSIFPCLALQESRGDGSSSGCLSLKATTASFIYSLFTSILSFSRRHHSSSATAYRARINAEHQIPGNSKQINSTLQIFQKTNLLNHSLFPPLHTL
jgi:hypothetical protein